MEHQQAHLERLRQEEALHTILLLARLDIAERREPAARNCAPCDVLKHALANLEVEVVAGRLWISFEEGSSAYAMQIVS